MSRSKLEIFFAGAFGGLGPNLIGMANQALRQTPDPQVGYLFSDLGFWVGALTLALVGGCVAFFYKETSAKKAIALGAAAPALMLGLAQGNPSGQTSPAHAAAGATVPVAAWVVGTAYAKETTTWQAPTEEFSIHVSGLQAASGSETDLVAVLASQPGRPPTESYPRELVFQLSPTDSVISVPRNVREVYVRVGGVTSNRLPIPDFTGDALTVVLEIPDKSFLTGFARALGFRNVGAKPPVIRIKP